MTVALWLIFTWLVIATLVVIAGVGAAVLHLGDLKAYVRTVIELQRGRFTCPGCGLHVERPER